MYSVLENAMPVVVVQSLRYIFVTPGTTACQAPLSSTISRSLLKFTSIESARPMGVLFKLI